jgi:hypothetical protein
MSPFDFPGTEAVRVGQSAPSWDIVIWQATLDTPRREGPALGAVRVDGDQARLPGS